MVHCSYTGTNNVFLAEHRSIALILKCHHEPLVISLSMSEHIDPNTLVIISETRHTLLKVLVLYPVLRKYGSETPCLTQVTVDCEL